MSSEPYARFKREELILRDYLAADRSALANERTFLAYIRTALTFGIGGASLIQFFDSGAAVAAGWALVPLAGATFAIGAQRYLRYRRRIGEIRDLHDSTGVSA